VQQSSDFYYRLLICDEAGALMLSKRFGLLFLLYALALSARLAAIAVIGLSYPMDNDEPEYYQPAVHIANGEGYRKVPQQSPDGVAHLTAYRMPGPALVLAVAFKLLGASYSLARFISALVSAAAAPLMYLWAQRVAPRGAALLAAVACALYPTYIYYSLRIFSEPYFIPILLLSLLLSVAAIESRTPWPSSLAGLSWGLTVMVRPHGLPIATVVALYFVCHKRWSRAALVALGVAAFLAPWLIRNQIVLGHPVLLATESGETLLGANNPYVYENPALHGMWVSPIRIPEYSERLKPVRDEVERSRLQSQISTDYLKRNPAQAPILAYYKLRRWLTPVTVTGGAIRLLVLASYGVMLVLLVLGVLLGVFRRTAALDITLNSTLVFVAVTAVYWGGLTRGRLPLEILWIPWGAWAAWDLAARLARRGLTVSPFSARDVIRSSTIN
jgi:4-amino-4-deoxy-L-arabinose transferase-like glycosyltransferase